MGLKTALLDLWRDVDTLADLQALIDACMDDSKKPKNERTFSTRTAGVLETLAKRIRSRA
jgi:hypothetical protein